MRFLILGPLEAYDGERKVPSVGPSSELCWRCCSCTNEVVSVTG